ncbi:MAG: site-specific integrase [Solirubrobacterales bacterium]|nr:site-specific integrase [Solirubrobacterales bacterium]
MVDRPAAPRRVRVERNIYRRASGVYEVGFKDLDGRQRWRTVDGGITAARAVRDELLVRRGRGERVATNPRLRFADAVSNWLGGPVVHLRPATQDCYRNASEQHLLPRYASRRLNAITPDDLANLVRELRGGGLAESTIAIVIGVTNRVYRYAARRLGWAGTNPVSLMLPSERPKPSQDVRRRLFQARELEQTIEAAPEPYRTLFTLAALTGARLSELLAIRWMNVMIADIDDAEVEFAQQVDRRGNLRPTKTEDSVRKVPIPRELALILERHRVRSTYVDAPDFVFCTRTGRPLGQRNVARALRLAQTNATDDAGNPTFPVLHVRDETGQPIQIPHGALPSMHSFRHTVASRALLAGESVDEVAFLLGHRDANVTRAVYVRELADARRRSMRRSRMITEFGDVLGMQKDE